MAFIPSLIKKCGPKKVLTSPADRLLYSYDAALDKALPSVIVLPQTTKDVSTAVSIAHEYGVSYVARGAGTNLCGGSIPSPDGLVLHLSGMNQILEVNQKQRTAWVEPGVVNLHLQNHLKSYGLFYPPDPASQKACTLGGNVGTNAGGPHCLKYGVTSNHVLALEMVLPGGEIIQTSVLDSGYDLTGLFVGAEGTLGVVTKIKLNLLHLPEDIKTFLISFSSMEAAAQTVTDIIAAGIVPSTLELMDRLTVEAVEKFIHAGYPRDAEAVLLLELDGSSKDIEKEIGPIQEICRKNQSQEFRQAKDEIEREKFWEGRRGSYPAMARLAPNVLVEDGVVPRQKLPEAMRRMRAIADREKLRMGLIAHAGDGNLHPNMIFDERNAEETKKVKAAGYEMLKVCVDLGGSISGEHGIGVDKREAMRWLFTPETLDAFHKIKKGFDPENICNPDKMIPQADSLNHFSVPSFQKDLLDKSNVQSIEEIQSIVMGTKRVCVRGKNTQGIPFPSDASIISLCKMNKILDHDKDNFTITVQPGISPDEVNAGISSFDQKLAIVGVGSLGGILSTKRIVFPFLRDQVLGMKVVLSDGRLVSLGAKVVKNVAGYDLMKLFVGAAGSLGVISEVTLRLFPLRIKKEIRKSQEPFLFEWINKPLNQKIKKILDAEEKFVSF